MKTPAVKGLSGAAARSVMLNLEKYTFLLNILIGHALCKWPPTASSHYTHIYLKSRGSDYKTYAQKEHLILVLITRFIKYATIYEKIYFPKRLILISTLVIVPTLFGSL